jgi:hypothetical protein
MQQSAIAAASAAFWRWIGRQQNTIEQPPPSVLPDPVAPKPTSLLDPARIVTAAVAYGAEWAPTAGRKHIFYIEGCNLDGTPNDNRIDKWNDVRGILEFVDGNPQVIFKCAATTVPGIYYDRTHVIGWGGKAAALIDTGYQACWQVGTHMEGRPDAHEALVQTGAVVKVWRDLNRSLTRGQGDVQSGWFGINQHSTGHGYAADPNSIGAWSAGCLVAEKMSDHVLFMSMIKKDPRYLADHKFVFGTIVLTQEMMA